MVCADRDEALGSCGSRCSAVYHGHDTYQWTCKCKSPSRQLDEPTEAAQGLALPQAICLKEMERKRLCLAPPTRALLQKLCRVVYSVWQSRQQTRSVGRPSALAWDPNRWPACPEKQGVLPQHSCSAHGAPHPSPLLLSGVGTTFSRPLMGARRSWVCCLSRLGQFLCRVICAGPRCSSESTAACLPSQELSAHRRLANPLSRRHLPGSSCSDLRACPVAAAGVAQGLKRSGRVVSVRRARLTMPAAAQGSRACRQHAAPRMAPGSGAGGAGDRKRRMRRGGRGRP